jgi:protein TonB
MKGYKMACLLLCIFGIIACRNTDQLVVQAGPDEVLKVVEVNPQFPGGLVAMQKWLRNNLKYPDVAQKKGISGRVLLKFVVGRDGAIRDIAVERGIDPSLDEEAVRVVSNMPKWTPGRQRGKFVSVQFFMPVSFTLSQQ